MIAIGEEPPNKYVSYITGVRNSKGGGRVMRGETGTNTRVSISGLLEQRLPMFNM